MLAHARMLCLLHIHVCVIRRYTLSLLQRILLYRKHRTHMILPVAKTLHFRVVGIPFSSGTFLCVLYPCPDCNAVQSKWTYPAGFKNASTSRFSEFMSCPEVPAVGHFLFVTTALHVVQMIHYYKIHRLMTFVGLNSITPDCAALRALGNPRYA